MERYTLIKLIQGKPCNRGDITDCYGGNFFFFIVRADEYDLFFSL